MLVLPALALAAFVPLSSEVIYGYPLLKVVGVCGDAPAVGVGPFHYNDA